MKNLTPSQLARLDDATGRIDKLADTRQMVVPDEAAVAALIAVCDAAVLQLETGRPLRISVADESNTTLASAAIQLER